MTYKYPVLMPKMFV